MEHGTLSQAWLGGRVWVQTGSVIMLQLNRQGIRLDLEAGLAVIQVDKVHHELISGERWF